jgi:asparagine synthetase B (glutamine-hydrolysing)
MIKFNTAWIYFFDMVQIDRSYCMSSFLTFRYVVDENIGWNKDFVPVFPETTSIGQHKIKSAEDTDKIMRKLVMNKYKKTNKMGLLLSGGIDSAIVAKYIPKSSVAYTIRFDAKDAIDESIKAKKYAEDCDLNHKIIDITWEDYKKYMSSLMNNKKSPLHPVEVGLYKTALIAKEDDVDLLVVGNGADSTFGGLDKLLSVDWKFNEFIKRYSFTNPERILNTPVSMNHVFEKYRKDKGIDVSNFLKTVHGLGVVQAFENAVEFAGCEIFAPYEELSLDIPLDMTKIRNGQSKYMLREIFKKLYPQFEIPIKIAFARPMDQWMEKWDGPKRMEFKDNINLDDFTGEQKWLIYCLEQFLNLMDE